MPARELPNIVYILADDMGCGDASCLNPGSKIPTPNIDALARRGMVFRDAHSNSAVCTPTRYGVLTGRYCWRGALQRGVLNGYSGPLIESGRATVASFLAAHGYATACIGKWHLGLGWQPQAHVPGSPTEPDFQFDAPVSAGPNTCGFQYSYVLPASLDMPPYCYLENHRVVELPGEQIGRSPRPAFWRGGRIAPSFRHQDCLWDFTRQAEQFIEQQARKQPARPFFLYLALPSPHTPHCPRAQFAGQSQAGEYGDLMVETDWTVGRVVEALRRSGLEDNTLVVFTSDNGCHDEPIGLKEKYGHFGNHIYRGQKSDAWDGGHRVPFVACWPGRIPAGSMCDRTVCLTDLAASCAAIVGAPLPDQSGEDSYNILPLLLGREGYPPRPALVHHSLEGYFAIRQDRWKLILCGGSGGWSLPEKNLAADAPRVQLYDMGDDPQEQRNVHVQHPQVVQKLTQLLEDFRRAGRSVAR
jgi:arylsulfatase A-like enzyme